MKNLNRAASAILLSGLFLTACSSNTNTDNTATDAAAVAVDTTPVNEYSEYLFQYTLLNLPPLLQTLSEFSQSNLPVDMSLLNSPDNASKYKTSSKQALNYGIYGIDLGYLAVNNRILDIKKYYSTTQQLAADLNMSESFNAYQARFEKYSENKDTLARLIDEAMISTDNYLRSNERLQTASEVLAGSWLECQYITVNLLKNQDRNADNEKLYQRVWEQRLYLDKISELLGTFKDDKDLTKLIANYNELLAMYKVPSDSKEITKDFLDKLSKKLGDVRKDVIS